MEISKASRFEPEDYISSMPDNVVSNILDRLPLQDAVRTCILARNWRFKWTTLSQLVFDRRLLMYLKKSKGGDDDYGRIISRLLLHVKGVVTKFVLEEKLNSSILDDEDINNWILFLSGKGIKVLTINYAYGSSLKLPTGPTHLFSCLELKHLNLYNCCFDPPPSFHGFPNLLSLKLDRVKAESTKLGEFLTKCPELEILDICSIFCSGKVKLAEIVKLANLKLLSLRLYNLDNTASSGILELVGSLAKLQELDLDFLCFKLIQDGALIQDSAKNRPPTTYSRLKLLLNLQTLKTTESNLLIQDRALIQESAKNRPPTTFSRLKLLLNLQTHKTTESKLLIQDGARNRLPTTFSCLKTLKLSKINLTDGIMLSYAFEMIRSFPNLQNLEITGHNWGVKRPPIVGSPKVDYNTSWQLQLKTVAFKYCKASENEICLIKYLLACSPFLKKIVFRLHPFLKSQERFTIAKKLLKLHRASPIVDIELNEF